MRGLDTLRVPAILCGVALFCFLGSCAYLNKPTDKVAQALTGVDRGRCNIVPGLRSLDCGALTLLELSRDPESAQEVRKAIQRGGVIDDAKSSVRRDYLFIPSYVALLGCLGLLAVRLAEIFGIGRIIPVLVLLTASLLVAGVMDGAENVGLMMMLVPAEGPISGGLVSWTLTSSTVKWWLVSLDLLVIPLTLLTLTLYGLWQWRKARRRAAANA